MDVLDIKDNNLIIRPEALALKYFAKIWEKDKSKFKENAHRDIKYVYFFCNYKSPYYKHQKEEREKLILSEVINDPKFKIDKDIQTALVGYSELCRTPTMDLLEDAKAGIYNMGKYLKDPNSDPDKIQKIIFNFPKMLLALNEADNIVKKEMSSVDKVRGDQQTGLLETDEL